MSTSKFKSVADAAADLAGDQEVVERVKKEIRKNTLVSLLLETRIAKGITQEQVAQAMGCDPSTVSRIESDNDRQLKWDHIIGYVSALKLQLSIIIDDGALPAAEKIKQCVFKIDQDLKKLAELAHEVGGQDHIAQEINRFYVQVLWNFVTKFAENYNALPNVIKIPPCPSPALRDADVEPAHETHLELESALEPAGT